MQFHFELEELDYQIPGGFWMDSVMNGDAQIDVDADGIWSVTAVEIYVCGTKLALYSDGPCRGYMDNSDMCRMVEESIKRSPSHLDSIEEEIRNAQILRAELRCDFA